MSKVKFTDLWLQKLTPPSSGEKHYGDATCSGLGIKHTSNNIKSFRFSFRLDKKTGTITFGKYPDISLRDARQMADEARRLVAKGIDPRKEKQDRRKEAEMTVAVMAKEFIEKYEKPRNRSWKQAEDNLRLHLLPKLGSTPIQQVKRADIHSILDNLLDQGKGTTANRALAHMRKFFKWLVRRDYLEHAPTEQVEQPYQETPRRRLLTDTELRALWHASEALSGPYKAFLRLSMLCGQREAETAHMRRSQISEEGWLLSGADTKNKREHMVPLSRQAREIVNDLLQQEGEFLLKSGVIGDKPINGFSSHKRQVNSLSGVEDWVLHDIRAAVISNLGRLGYSQYLIKKVVNHIEKDVTADYDRYPYYQEKLDALQAWADRLDEIIAG